MGGGAIFLVIVAELRTDNELPRSRTRGVTGKASVFIN